jgi:hypothetical protein
MALGIGKTSRSDFERKSLEEFYSPFYEEIPLETVLEIKRGVR